MMRKIDLFIGAGGELYIKRTRSRAAGMGCVRRVSQQEGRGTEDSLLFCGSVVTVGQTARAYGILYDIAGIGDFDLSLCQLW
ncbi:MAG: hypothetical protein LUI87_09645 [Lachnospiraceae bacterium]|nr:hypothetical protein [Lachnospiraceae bacterium]